MWKKIIISMLFASTFFSCAKITVDEDACKDWEKKCSGPDGVGKYRVATCLDGAWIVSAPYYNIEEEICNDDEKCVEDGDNAECVKIDTGNTGNTGNTGDTGNTGNTGDNFPNEHDGLNWSDKAPDTMNWDDAVEYCEGLGGRLPTISELRTLIQNCPATETGGGCEVTDDCLNSNCWSEACYCEEDNSGKYLIFGDTIYLWSSLEILDNTDYVWSVNGNEGRVHGGSKTVTEFVRCVR